MATNVSEIVNSARFNWYHLRICLLCAMLVLVDGFDLSAISYAAGDFVKFLGVDRAVMGPVFSTGFFGLSFGALTFGLIGDRWGPKRTFILCGLIFGVFTLATAAATSLTMLLVLRAIAGWGLGGATPLSIAIASEYLPQRLRTSLVMVMYISLALGIMVGGYVFAYVTLFGWRTVFIVGGILPFLCSPFLYAYLPERLEFMVMKGFAPARIAAVLARVVPGRDFSRETGFTVDQENKPGFQLAQLFQERRAAITSVLWVVFFSSLLAVYFFNAWLPLLLASYGLSQPDVVKINSSLQLGGIAGTIVAATFVIALGGFRTVAAGYFVAALDRRAGYGAAHVRLPVRRLARLGVLPGRDPERAQCVLRQSLSARHPRHRRGLGLRHRPHRRHRQPERRRHPARTALAAERPFSAGGDPDLVRLGLGPRRAAAGRKAPARPGGRARGIDHRSR